MADKGNYGKRPLWQWILIYVVVGGIIYFAIYYFFLSKHGGYSAPGSGSSTQSAPSTGY
jgi:hypothetical protein